MLEAIMDRRNIEKALVQVMHNKGSAGVDGMQTDELRDYLHNSYQQLYSSIIAGSYEPDPVRKVEIPKPQGGVRMLGIPTVVDRLIQQAISQWLSQFYEPPLQRQQLWVQTQTQRTSGRTTGTVIT